MSILSRYWLTGRREAVRRQGDRQKAYRIDRHSSKTLGASLLFITLSILDGVLTLFLISEGASEINPIMAYFLDHGPLAFFGAKYLLTCFCVVFVLLNANSYLFGTKVRAKILFVLGAIPFALAIKWELYIIFFIL
jgi:hypothetical protein